MDEEFRKAHYAKLFYRPIEVAIRWCGLMQCERKILGENEPSLMRRGHTQTYPCIQHKIEILLDAIRNHDLRYGCLGINVSTGEYVEPNLLTIRHIDLKQWLLQFRPAEKPHFLFDELERNIVQPFKPDVYTSLLAEIEIYKIQHKHDQSSLLKLGSLENSEKIVR